MVLNKLRISFLIIGYMRPVAIVATQISGKAVELSLMKIQTKSGKANSSN